MFHRKQRAPVLVQQLLVFFWGPPCRSSWVAFTRVILSHSASWEPVDMERTQGLSQHGTNQFSTHAFPLLCASLKRVFLGLRLRQTRHMTSWNLLKSQNFCLRCPRGPSPGPAHFIPQRYQWHNDNAFSVRELCMLTRYGQCWRTFLKQMPPRWRGHGRTLEQYRRAKENSSEETVRTDFGQSPANLVGDIGEAGRLPHIWANLANITQDSLQWIWIQSKHRSVFEQRRINGLCFQRFLKHVENMLGNALGTT